MTRVLINTITINVDASQGINAKVSIKTRLRGNMKNVEETVGPFIVLDGQEELFFYYIEDAIISLFHMVRDLSLK